MHVVLIEWSHKELKRLIRGVAWCVFLALRNGKHFVIQLIDLGAKVTSNFLMVNSTDYLITEYVRRRNGNSRYSERAFAQAIGLSPGFMNLLFKGKKQLSLARAADIAHRLNWTES